MRSAILAAAILLALPLAAQASTPDSGKKCQSDAPYRYRISYNYFGGRNSPQEYGSAAMVGCLSREIKNEADWEWLHKTIEVHPEVTRVTIVGVALLTD